MSELVDAESGKPPAITSATFDIAIMMLTRLTQTATIILPLQQPRKILKQGSLEREKERLQSALARRPRSPAKESTGDFVAWSRRVVPHCVVFVLLHEHLFYFILFYKKIECFAIPMGFELWAHVTREVGIGTYHLFPYSFFFLLKYSTKNKPTKSKFPKFILSPLCKNSPKNPCKEGSKNWYLWVLAHYFKLHWLSTKVQG
jgi:hypothetical protein